MPQFTEKYLARHEAGLFKDDYEEYETKEEAEAGMKEMIQDLPVGYGPYALAVIRVMEIREATHSGTAR